MVPLGYCSGWVAGRSLAGPVGFKFSDICFHCVKWAIELSILHFQHLSTQEFFSSPQKYLERHLLWGRLPSVTCRQHGTYWASLVCIESVGFGWRCGPLSPSHPPQVVAFWWNWEGCSVLLDGSSGTPPLPSSPLDPVCCMFTLALIFPDI